MLPMIIFGVILRISIVLLGGSGTGKPAVAVPKTATTPGGYSGLDDNVVDLSVASAFTYSDLRTVGQLQRYMERVARGGTRYVEILRNVHGVYPRTIGSSDQSLSADVAQKFCFPKFYSNLKLLRVLVDPLR